MTMNPNGYSTWQEALAALVKENGLQDSELGDISRRALTPTRGVKRSLLLIRIAERDRKIEWLEERGRRNRAHRCRLTDPDP